MRRHHVFDRSAARGPRSAYHEIKPRPAGIIVPDVAALQVLLEQVEAANGPDAMLDRDLLSALHRQGYRIVGSARPTGSIDAAVGLIEITLPGWEWSCGAGLDGKDGWVAPDAGNPDAHLDPKSEGFIGDAEGSNVLLSLLSAMLQGLIAKAMKQDGVL